MTHLLLSLDPSSKALGWALVDLHTAAYHLSGVCKPPAHWDANRRIRRMWEFAAEIDSGYSPAVILLEDTSGKVSGRHRGAGAGLSVYGKAVGYIMGRLDAREEPHLRSGPSRVVLVKENDWTRGKKKEKRLALCPLHYPQYDPARDEGGDEGDALMMANWWIVQERIDRALSIAKKRGKRHEV